MKSAIIIACILLLATSLAASVPPMINYQGKLMQPSGAPVPDGTYSMQFAIYDDPVSTDPAHKLWGETNPSVQVKGGLFAVLLGSVNNLGPNLFDSPNRFFGVKVGGDVEMTPRQQIASSAFAFRAAVAGTVDDGAITTSKIAPLAIDGPSLAALSVSTDKIMDKAVTTAKIDDGAVTAAKMEDQQAWANVQFNNGWRDYDAAGWGHARYMKDSLGFVHVQGMVALGAVGKSVFTFPAGYRPATTLGFGTVAGCSAVLCDVHSDGTVWFECDTGTQIWYSLAAITFKAEQ